MDVVKRKRETLERAVTEEETIIERVLNGELEAFAELIEMYQEPLMRMTYQFLHDREGSRDLVQDVFVAVYQNLPSYDPARSRFSTWIYTVARNRCKNALRKKRPVVMSEPPEQPDEETPVAQARKREVFQALDKALEALPGGMKRVFVLSEMEGLPQSEIARIEGVSVGTVKSRLNRAKGRLQELLKGWREDE